MLRNFISAIIAVVVFGIAGTANALIIHESASLGPTGIIGGFAITNQFLGSRFSVASTVNVTDVGGHISSTVAGTLFAAMTEHQLGNEEEARGLLAEADQLIEKLASQNLAGLTLGLHREAEALINGDTETEDGETEDAAKSAAP